MRREGADVQCNECEAWYRSAESESCPDCRRRDEPKGPDDCHTLNGVDRDVMNNPEWYNPGRGRRIW